MVQSQGPKQPLPCGKSAQKLVCEEKNFFRNEQLLHATKNVGVSIKKGRSPTTVAKNDNGTCERKAKWDEMRKVHDAMSSSVKQA